MKLGVFTTMDRVDNASIQEWLEILVQTESMGYASVWLAELHFQENSLSAAPSLYLATLASRTQNIRLGYGVKLLALHHPLHIAEELITLQHLSNGRIIFGVGKGTPFSSQNTPFGLIESDLRTNMYDTLHALHSLWNHTNSSYNSSRFSFQDITLSPEPSFPFPETVVASFGSLESLEKITNSTYSLILGSPFETEALVMALESLDKQKTPLYLTRFSAVDKNHKRARRKAEPFLKRWLEKAGKSAMFADIKDPMQMLMNTSLIGDLVFCREQLEQYKELLNPKEILIEPIDSTLIQKRTTLDNMANLLT